jgi:hypothetical protein
MLKYIKDNNKEKYSYIFYAPGNISTGYMNITIYPHDYIMNLYREITRLAKEKNVKIKKIHKTSELKQLNEKLDEYIENNKKYLKLLQELDFVNEEYITLNEFHQVCDIANEHGRPGSPKCAYFKDVKEIIYHLEKTLELLQNENVIQIGI